MPLGLLFGKLLLLTVALLPADDILTLTVLELELGWLTTNLLNRKLP